MARDRSLIQQDIHRAEELIAKHRFGMHKIIQQSCQDYASCLYNPDPRILCMSNSVIVLDLDDGPG